jgi:hypothetical protein
MGGRLFYKKNRELFLQESILEGSCGFPICLNHINEKGKRLLLRHRNRPEVSAKINRLGTRSQKLS